MRVSKNPLKASLNWGIIFSLLKSGELKASWKKAKGKLKAGERQSKVKLKAS